MNDILEVESRDGTPIAVERVGSGPPLVLLHGSVADRTYWARAVALLAETFTCHLVDRRGRGASGSVDPAWYSVEREYEDVVAVLEALDRPAHVLGHSYGAVCALGAALLTDRIDRLITYEPPLPLVAPVVPHSEALAEMAAALRDEDRDLALRAAWRSIGLPPAAIDEMIADSDTSSPISWPRMLALADTWLPELVACLDLPADPSHYVPIERPTLILVGTDNPQRTMKALLCALPNARMWSLPGQGHEAAVTAPALFATEVTRFLVDG